MHAISFRQKADHCRRLARSLTASDDPTIGRLMALSNEFEAKAVAVDREEKLSRLIDSLGQEDALPSFIN